MGFIYEEKQSQSLLVDFIWRTEDLSFANFAERKVNATKLGIHTADA